MKSPEIEMKMHESLSERPKQTQIYQLAFLI